MGRSTILRVRRKRIVVGGAMRPSHWEGTDSEWYASAQNQRLDEKSADDFYNYLGSYFPSRHQIYDVVDAASRAFTNLAPRIAAPLAYASGYGPIGATLVGLATEGTSQTVHNYAQSKANQMAYTSINRAVQKAQHEKEIAATAHPLLPPVKSYFTTSGKEARPTRRARGKKRTAKEKKATLATIAKMTMIKVKGRRATKSAPRTRRQATKARSKVIRKTRTKKGKGVKDKLKTAAKVLIPIAGVSAAVLAGIAHSKHKDDQALKQGLISKGRWPQVKKHPETGKVITHNPYHKKLY